MCVVFGRVFGLWPGSECRYSCMSVGWPHHRGCPQAVARQSRWSRAAHHRSYSVAAVASSRSGHSVVVRVGCTTVRQWLGSVAAVAVTHFLDVQSVGICGGSGLITGGALKRWLGRLGGQGLLLTGPNLWRPWPHHGGTVVSGHSRWLRG